MQFRFPDTFWWGSASSAPQAEGASLQGGKAPTIWDHWFAIEPNRFHQQVGPADTSTFYQHFRDDIALMQEIGHNSFRTSISWARLLPQGRGEPNPEAVRFYHAMLDELLARGITPFINLFHFDMPMSMQEQGGWESRKVVDAFAEFAATCFRLFGGKVKHWFTFNEPIVPVEGGYLYDFHYPNVVDFRRAATVAYHTMLAHAKAVQAYRAQGQDGQIGIILNLTPSYPRSQHPADLKAANIADLFFNRSFLDPAVKGEYPTELVALLREYDQLPASEPEDRALLAAGKVDLLGVNYYQPRRVKARSNAVNPASPFMPEWFFDYYEMPGRKMNPHRGWEIYEKGIYDILVNLRDHYGNIPCFISENGMGVEGEEKFLGEQGQIQDDYRIAFIRDHLSWVHKGIGEGCQCLGYHLWTFVDNWSWSNAYKNRYGFVRLDLATGERRIKKSGEWFADVSRNGGF
ncbi:glycoside hydrolase family 1 protein [Aeromonas caviae]|uniref:Glycosyl hydrolase n=1 Tax=Aeromonas caviae TaxID=648 RepID=A0AAV4YHJ1_AERCA|nr:MULTISPECIES: glycoside hydrolase family 1 protein [Aeromonas]KEP91194.1 6-phospho-beta-glucosidase [Aeromonas caviae]MBL0548506.1 glycoside hydrolase family 1 protein [Aeromonas caviae]MBL0552345.1 glycoside hydrolase family 1 protein [Aeromonas caviae]MBP4068245.1 glycoside hydrolase family 1 protein [Aeromonas sp. MaB10011B]MBP4078145.1 glycoside hydrolase family 1 protein [Aeromonas sp. MrichA-1]